MSTQKFYDKIVARNYSSNPFNQHIFEETFTELLSKSLSLYHGNQKAPKVLDVGCGDAGFMKLFKQKVQNSVLCGIDISSVMMEKGQEEIEFLSIHMDAIKGLKLLIQMEMKFDFIVLSFVSAYLDLKELLPLIKQLLSSKGLVMYQSSLKSSFPSMRDIVNNQYKQSKNPLKSTVAQQLEQGIKNSYLFSSIDELNQLFLKEGMVKLESYVKTVDLEFTSFHECLDFFHSGGWVAPYLSGYRFIFIYLLLLCKVYSYPKKEKAIIGCMIASLEDNALSGL